MNVPINTTVDLIALANVANYMQTNCNKHVKSKSQILWFAIETINHNIPHAIVDEQQALDFLASLDIGIKSGNKRQITCVSKLADIVIPQQQCDSILSDQRALENEARKIAAIIDRQQQR